VADLAVPDAVDVLVWMARSLLTAVLTESVDHPEDGNSGPDPEPGAAPSSAGRT
jgi:hypothetical protein